MVRNRDVTGGLALLRSGSAAYRASGAKLWVPYFIALLARAYGIAGEIETGLILFDDALQIAERTGERWFAAELNRQKAGCCCDRAIPRPRRSSIARPSASPRSRGPSSGNCAPPRASPAFGATRAGTGTPRPAISSPRSTFGLPRVSKCRTSKSRGRCSTSSMDRRSRRHCATLSLRRLGVERVAAAFRADNFDWIRAQISLLRRNSLPAPLSVVPANAGTHHDAAPRLAGRGTRAPLRRAHAPARRCAASRPGCRWRRDRCRRPPHAPGVFSGAGIVR